MCTQKSTDESISSTSTSTISTEKIFIENTNICIAPLKKDIIDYINDNKITNLYLFSEDKISIKNNKSNNFERISVTTKKIKKLKHKWQQKGIQNNNKDQIENLLYKRIDMELVQQRCKK